MLSNLVSPPGALKSGSPPGAFKPGSPPGALKPGSPPGALKLGSALSAVKFAVKSKCSIAEALFVEMEFPSSLSVEAMLTGNTETDDFFILQTTLNQCCGH